MSALERQALKQKIGVSGLPPMPPAGVGGKRALIRKKDYSPVYWDNYFEKMHDVKCKENTFRVYECGEEGPVLFFLHGGGFSALSWAVLSKTVSHLVTCRCAAIDLRGHGDTETADDGDLSAQRLSGDIGEVVAELYGDEPPPIVLVGHSMGGAIAVHVAEQKLIPSLMGLCVIDVVEGTAMEALASMQSFLRGRPSVFKSLDHAIEWCVRSGQVRNLESAKVSMVGQVKRTDNNETGLAELEHQHSDPHTAPPISSPPADTILEEEEGEEEEESSEHKEAPSPQVPSSSRPDKPATTMTTTSHDVQFTKPPAPQSTSTYTWRIDLGKTEPYWRGWFEGLSQRFLSVDAPKLLLLAGVDRLDRELTIGQMQGKFQMQVLPQSGHAVHEDVPDKVADMLATFLTRYKLATPTANFERTFPGC